MIDSFVSGLFAWWTDYYFSFRLQNTSPVHSSVRVSNNINAAEYVINSCNSNSATRTSGMKEDNLKTRLDDWWSLNDEKPKGKTARYEKICRVLRNKIREEWKQTKDNFIKSWEFSLVNLAYKKTTCSETAMRTLKILDERNQEMCISKDRNKTEGPMCWTNVAN